MITNQITTANTFNDWVVSTQAIITYLNDNEMLPNTAIEIANSAYDIAVYANSQVDLAFIKSQESHDASNNSLIITGFAYDTANVANTTGNYAYDQANTGTSIANYANNVAIFANTRINTIYNGSEILVPTGNTTQRPVTPSTGMFRYNTDTNQFEGYATAWMPVGGVPIGAVIPFIGGYFTNGSNAGYTNVLGGTAGNTIANVNSLLNSTGWYVCNGATINLANSPIFNGSNRYLPNITDSRFIMGSTSSGSIGGSNSTDHLHVMNGHTHGMGHTHPIPHTHNVAAHSHTMQSHEHTVPNHTHGIPIHGHGHTFAVVSNTLTIANLAAHTHGIGVQHNSSSNLGAGSSFKTVNIVSPGYTSTSTGSTTAHGHTLSGAVSNAAGFKTSDRPEFRTTGGPVDSSGTALNNTSTTSLVTQGTNTTDSSATTKTITDSTTSTSQSTTIENRPSFISCIYIMRVF